MKSIFSRVGIQVPNPHLEFKVLQMGTHGVSASEEGRGSVLMVLRREVERLEDFVKMVLSFYRDVPIVFT